MYNVQIRPLYPPTPISPMKKIQAIVDVYPAIDELVIELKTVGQFKLADTLHHRMHMVAWTSGSELLEELQKVFTDTLQANDVTFPAPIENQIQQIMHVIKWQA